MKKNVTRSALFTSIIALLLCVAMLVGTTFAWFTDEVVSAQNTIQAGNLDVELYYSDDMATWTPVETTTNIFEAGKWEPGHTEVVYLQVKNAGSLNLKYQLGVGIVSETGSKTADGVEFKLSQFIEYGIDDTVSAKYADRKAAVAALQSATKLATPFSSDVITLAPGATKEVALVVYMPETVDNDANHGKGEAVPTINLGLNVYATQVEAEDDSFGIDYDKGAYLPTVYTADELVSAMENGDSVKLGDDIDLYAGSENGNFVIPAEAGEVVLDLGGYTLTAPAREGYTGRTQYALDNYADLTITGEGTIVSRGVQNYGKLTVTDGVTLVANDVGGGAAIYSYAGSETVINGGTFTAEQNAACVITYGDLTVNSGTFTQTGAVGATYAIIAHGNNIVLNNANVTGVHGAVGCTSGANATINSGTYTMTGVVGQSDHVIYGADANIKVNGGTFKGEYDAGGKVLYQNTNATITATGGTYDQNPTSYVPAGYEVVPNADGTFTVQPENLVSNTAELIDAIKNAPIGEVTTINVADGTYAEDITFTTEAIGAQGGDVVIKAAGQNAKFTGLITVGNRQNGAIVLSKWDANITFEGVIFDQAQGGKHSIDVQNVKAFNMNRCTIIGDGEYGFSSASGCNVDPSYVSYCTFQNAAMQIYGGYGSGLRIEKSTFNDSRANVCAGTGVTVEDCVFNATLTDAHVDDSFYMVRGSTNGNGIPVTITGCKMNVDSAVTGIAAAQAKWGIIWNRGSVTPWTVEDVDVVLTDAALAQTELMVVKTGGAPINTTDLTINGVTQ